MDYIEDVVQDTFVSYARYKYSLDMSEESQEGAADTYSEEPVYGFHRRMKYRSYGELDEEAYNSEDYPAHDKAANLPDYVVSKERCQALLVEIERMPENWRQVATLRLIEGRPTREVCAMLNITEKACYSRVSRIRKYLEELLKK